MVIIVTPSSATKWRFKTHFFAIVVCMQLAYLAGLIVLCLIVIFTLCKDTYFVAPQEIYLMN